MPSGSSILVLFFMWPLSIIRTGCYYFCPQIVLCYRASRSEYWHLSLSHYLNKNTLPFYFYFFCKSWLFLNDTPIKNVAIALRFILISYIRLMWHWYNPRIVEGISMNMLLMVTVVVTILVWNAVKWNEQHYSIYSKIVASSCSKILMVQHLARSLSGMWARGPDCKQGVWPQQRLVAKACDVDHGPEPGLRFGTLVIKKMGRVSARARDAGG